LVAAVVMPAIETFLRNLDMGTYLVSFTQNSLELKWVKEIILLIMLLITGFLTVCNVLVRTSSRFSLSDPYYLGGSGRSVGMLSVSGDLALSKVAQSQNGLEPKSVRLTTLTRPNK